MDYTRFLTAKALNRKAEPINALGKKNVNF